MRLTKERFGGLLFLLLSLAYGYHATQIPGYPGDEYEPFTASTLPYALAGLGALLSLLLVLFPGGQGESVNILLNFTQFFETRIEYRFQIFTAHSCDFLLPSYARLA